MSKAIVLLLFVNFFCFFLLGNYIAHATTFNVGDSAGWTFGVSSWPDGKTFMAGDTLVFKYPVGTHTVVMVDSEANYNSCMATGHLFKSGNDSIVLPAGTSYFVCGFLGHCARGMKIAVTAN